MHASTKLNVYQKPFLEQKQTELSSKKSTFPSSKAQLFLWFLLCLFFLLFLFFIIFLFHSSQENSALLLIFAYKLNNLRMKRKRRKENIFTSHEHFLSSYFFFLKIIIILSWLPACLLIFTKKNKITHSYM